jgi:branched-chain amino acid transport system permease protein
MSAIEILRQANDTPPIPVQERRPHRPRALARRSAVLLGLVLLALVAVPLVLPSGLAGALSRVLALALLAVSLDLLTGVAGMPSLGHAAPFGVGAYVAGITAREVSSFAPVPLLLAIVAAALFSAATGWLVVRARGTYLLMLTLAVAELAHTLASQWDAVTGGSNGLVGVPAITLAPGGEPVLLAGIRYWWVLTIFLVGFAAIAWTARSNFGRSLRGLRDNEERMSSLGYSTFGLKYGVFCISGAVAGAAGAAWVVQARFVSPEDLGFEVSAMALLAIVVGGRGRLWGAVLGAALVTLVRNEIGTQLGGHGPLLLGLVFIAAVYVLPRGFAGTRWRRLLRRRREA